MVSSSITHASARAADRAENFHPPVTEAEKTIAKILELNASSTHSASVYYYLTGYKKSADDAYYATLFTKALRDSIIKANRAALNANCGGKYKEGEMCGLEINPVNCSTDVSNMYFFRTEKQTGRKAVVSYAWPKEHEATATYELHKIAHRWMLDAVACSGGTKFNWDNGIADLTARRSQ